MDSDSAPVSDPAPDSGSGSDSDRASAIALRYPARMPLRPWLLVALLALTVATVVAPPLDACPQRVTVLLHRDRVLPPNPTVFVGFSRRHVEPRVLVRDDAGVVPVTMRPIDVLGTVVWAVEIPRTSGSISIVDESGRRIDARITPRAAHHARITSVTRRGDRTVMKVDSAGVGFWSSEGGGRPVLAHGDSTALHATGRPPTAMIAHFVDGTTQRIAVPPPRAACGGGSALYLALAAFGAIGALGAMFVIRRRRRVTPVV